MNNQSNNSKETIKDHRMILERIAHIDKLYDAVGKRLKTTHFITIISLFIIILLSVGGGLLHKVWQLSNGVAKIEGLLMKIVGG